MELSRIRNASINWFPKRTKSFWFWWGFTEIFSFLLIWFFRKPFTYIFQKWKKRVLLLLFLLQWQSQIQSWSTFICIFLNIKVNKIFLFLHKLSIQNKWEQLGLSRSFIWNRKREEIVFFFTWRTFLVVPKVCSKSYVDLKVCWFLFPVSFYFIWPKERAD